MRYCVALGSNGPAECRLKYAESDMEAISDMLIDPAFGFDACVLKASNYSLQDARRTLNEVCERTSRSDDLLVIFSGHGVLAKGELAFLWSDDTNLLSNSLWGTELLRALRHSRARRKLLILDCCNAGALLQVPGAKGLAERGFEELLDGGHSFLILAAAAKLEQTREIERGGRWGGFLTGAVIEVLANGIAEFPTRRITVSDLAKQVEIAAVRHNSWAPSTVPVPYLVGESRLPFVLTDKYSFDSYVVDSPTENTLQLLPGSVVSTSGGERYALSVSRYPTTNREYRRFVDSDAAVSLQSLSASYSKYLESIQHYSPREASLLRNPSNPRVEGAAKLVTPRMPGGYRLEPRGNAVRRVAGFKPWEDQAYCGPLQPVVAIDLLDAIAFCHWASGLQPGFRFMLPTRRLLEIASQPNADSGPPAVAMSAPAKVDRAFPHRSTIGAIDVVGNVWEWFVGDGGSYQAVATVAAAGWKRPDEPGVFGGGAFSDPRVYDGREAVWQHQLFGDDGVWTRHNDLGFRTCAWIREDHWPDGFRSYSDRLSAGESYLRRSSFAEADWSLRWLLRPPHR